MAFNWSICFEVDQASMQFFFLLVVSLSNGILTVCVSNYLIWRRYSFNKDQVQGKSFSTDQTSSMYSIMTWYERKEGRKEVDRKETRSKQATNLTNLFTGIADTISNGKI